MYESFIFVDTQLHVPWTKALIKDLCIAVQGKRSLYN